MSRALFTRTDAAAYLGDMSVKTLDRLIKNGDLPSVKIGSRRFIDPADLDKFIADRRTFRIELAS